MDFKLIFPVSLMERYIELRNTIIDLIFDTQPIYLIGSKAQIFQGNLLSLLPG